MANSIVQSNLIKNKINITHRMAVELFNFVGTNKIDSVLCK